MRRPLRIALAAIGLAAAVYAGASLTGGWLGTPPWWERWSSVEAEGVVSGPGLPARLQAHGSMEVAVPREGREAISLALAAVGLALFAWAAWPRRRVSLRS